MSQSSSIGAELRAQLRRALRRWALDEEEQQLLRQHGELVRERAALARHFSRVYCSCCRSDAPLFVPLAYTPHGVCIHCSSYHRHRLLMLYLERETDLLTSNRRRSLLHVAPEACLADRIRANPRIAYFATDRFAPGYGYSSSVVKSELGALPFAPGSFDVVLCSHVLEHVEDDALAMREIARSLRPGGWAVLMVPLADRAATCEDPSIRDPAAREAAYGQSDHVRYYGWDFADRVAAAGFAVETIRYSERFPAAEVRRLGLLVGADDTIFVARVAS